MKKDTDNQSPKNSHESSHDSDQITKKSQAKETAIDESADTSSGSDSAANGVETKLTQKERDALALSEIESTEVIAADGAQAQDPDQEVKIVRQFQRDHWWKKRKVFIPAGIFLLLAILFAVPQTRYLALGWVWHQDVKVVVQDSRTGTALKNATVAIGSSSAETDESGVAVVKGVSLGYHDIAVKKTNYAQTTQSVAIDIVPLNSRTVSLVATGTLVSLTVGDKVSGKAIADAVVTSGSAVIGKTNASGKIDIVIPVNKQQLTVSVTVSAYNVLKTEVTNKATRLSLTPMGALYFLSKQSGKLDVVKANLDGTDRKVVVPGTGSEDDRDTGLISSKDWKYSILKTKRAVNKPASLYVITTTDDKYAIVDDANVDFTPIGWSGHYFMYKTVRANETWRAGSMQLKSYNADTGKTVTLDQSASDMASTQQSALYELIDTTNVIDGKLVYTKGWTMYGSPALSLEGKQAVIASVKPDGTDKKTIKSFSMTTTSWVSSRLYQPRLIYFQTGSQGAPQKYTYSELNGDEYTENVTPAADFASATYLTYIVSPSGNALLWAEERDGKQSLFVGDKNAGSKQEIASKSDYKPYGWLTDDWLLLQKNDSELYITTKDQLKKGVEPLKVSDYHRSANGHSGYGYGG